VQENKHAFDEGIRGAAAEGERVRESAVVDNVDETVAPQLDPVEDTAVKKIVSPRDASYRIFKVMSTSKRI
jgi:hypothetical protein